MTGINLRTKASRVRFKLLALVVALVMMVTSVPTAIAFETAASVWTLAEQTFTLNPEEGVCVTLSGMMPAGGHAEAVPADVEGDDILHAYDITIYRSDDTAFEPGEDAPISVSFASSDISLAIADEDTALSVEHIADDGTVESVDVTAVCEDELVFEAESFSIYVVKEHDTQSGTATKRRVYRYLSNIYEPYTDSERAIAAGWYVSGLYEFPNKAGDKVSQQIVKNGEKLQPVVMPENFEWGFFYGWYIVDIDLERSKAATAEALGVDVSEISEDTLTRFVYEWEDNPSAIHTNVTINDITEDETVYLAPLYTNYRFVTFHETEHVEGQPSNIVTRKIAALGHNGSAHIDISDISTVSPDPQKYVFYGWRHGDTVYKTREANGDTIHVEIEVNEENTAEGSSIDLFPVYREARWITFDAGGNGALFVGARFTYLDTDEEPAVVRQLPSTSRAGYIFDGWYTGSKENGVITYDKQVSMAFSTEGQAGNTAIVPTQGQRIELDEYGTYNLSGELHLREEIILYAKWRPVNAADYKVVVWQQKVTDSKTAADSEKTYDYYDYTLVEDAAAGSVILDSSEYAALGYENLSFTGFHYSRTEVVTDGVAYNGSIPAERAQGVVAPDSTTVVNVYYDRDLMTIHFNYNDADHRHTDAEGDEIKIGNSYYSISENNSIIVSDGTVYYLTRQNYTTPYTGTIYYRENNRGYSTTSPTYDNQYYRSQTLTTNSYKLTWNTYTGERYSSALTWTGLYEQTFEQNGYAWATVAGTVWKETSGSITQTMLSGFTQTDNPYNLTANGNNGTSEIRHYKQGLNGKYVYEDAVIARTSGSSSNFNFSNKFEGFTVSSYTSGTFNENGTGSAASDGSSATISLPGHIYHTRNKYTLTLANYNTDNTDKVFDGDQKIYYEGSLADYNLTPPERLRYIFGGWYEDKSCTKAFDFENEKMPAANKIIYAKWDLRRYFVEIDPAGGEMENETVFSAYTGVESAKYQSTYTKLDYGETLAEYQNVVRTYVPDNNGSYVYINVKFDETFEQAKEKDWSRKLPANYRAAFYCPITEVDQVFNDYYLTMTDKYGNLVNEHEELISRAFFKEYCVSKQAYSKIDGQEGYDLLAWYRVDENGNTTNEIYNFADAVTEPVHIRAVWRKSGAYYLEFDPYMPLYNIGQHVPVTDEEGNTTIMDNEIIYAPVNPNALAPGEIGERFVDGGDAVIRQEPAHIPDRYVFRGWELLDRNGTGTGQYYDPGDAFMIESKYADHDGIIHFRACYEPEKETERRVDVTSLTLDANGGYTVKNGLDESENYVYVDMQSNEVRFVKQMNNFVVNLKDYYNSFNHSDGYMLLGWDENRTPENFIPTYSADAVVGVDSKSANTLYAAWEAMYYLTLENFSPDYDITFNLSFAEYDGDIYSGNTNTVISTFERELFSEHNLHSDDGIMVTKNSRGNFTVTIPKADDETHPTRIKLVLPEGADAVYTVSGSIADAVHTNGNALNRVGNDLYVYNSGGAGEKMSHGSYSSYNQVYSYRNLNNQTATTYSVSGAMKLGPEGQNVAFYTGEPPKATIYVASSYYDLSDGEWHQGNKTTGACATLGFEDVSALGGIAEYTDDEITGISGLTIIKNVANTFSINQSFKNSDYKFIGWYTQPYAAPDAPSLDGMTTNFGAAKVTDLTVPNEVNSTYYALYVPIVNGDVKITHERAADSVGYAKKLYVSAHEVPTKRSDPGEYTAEDTAVNDEGDLNYRAKAEIEVPVTEEQAEHDDTITVTLKAMAGYGCTYNATYEGVHPFANGSRDDDSATTVYLDANDDTTPSETKYYYTYTRELSVADLYEDSETVKGLKTLNTKAYYSDFKRNYEFTYIYTSRDGVVRKYVVPGMISHKPEDPEKFVLERAPYISNFGEVYRWDTSTIKVNNLDQKGKITATMRSAQEKLAKVNVDVKRYGSDILIRWQTDQGRSFPADNCPVAEKVIDTPEGRKQFYRWKITETKSGKLVAYCYYHVFTFAVWNDYTIEEEYIDMQGEEYERITPDDETDTYVTLDYLDSTRNQWVSLDDNGDVRLDSEGNMIVNDKLISDFSIAFIDQGHRINADPDRAARYQLGLLMENVDTISSSTDMSNYTLPEDTTAALRERVVNMIKDRTDEYGTISSKGKPKFYYSRISPDDLNHDNRIEYYRAIDNLMDDDGTPAENSNALYVFNVYAYMVKDGTVYISETPVTLQMYHLAIMTTG